MDIAIISLDGKHVGVANTEPQGVGLVTWFHRNCLGYSMDHAIAHEGYSVENVEEIDCHDVSAFIEAICARVGVTMEAQFVPFSTSRNAKEKSPRVNWKVIFSRNGRAFLETDYTSSIADLPAYKIKTKNRWEEDRKEDAIALECETGKVAKKSWSHNQPFFSGREAIPSPRLGDVMHSLVRDSDVLESGGFDEWASEFGYDSDSMKAKQIFDACMEIALKLKGAIGNETLEELRLVSQFN